MVDYAPSDQLTNRPSDHLTKFGVAAGPAGVVAIGAVLAADFIWGFGITPIIYKEFGLNEKRHLQPLGGGTP